MLFVLGVLALAIYFLFHPVSNYFSEGLRHDWFKYLLIFTIFSLLSQLIVYWKMLQKRSWIIAIWSLLWFAFKCLAFVHAFLNGEDLTSALRNLMWVGVAFSLVSTVWIGYDFIPKINWKYQQEISTVGVGLALYGLLGILPQYTDAFLINFFYHDDGVLAIYRYGAKEIPFLGALTAGVVSAGLPLLKTDKQKGIDFILMETKKLIRLVLPAACILILLAPWIFSKVYDDSFTLSGLLFGLMLISVLPRLIFAQTIIMYVGNTKVLLLVAFGELIVNIVLSVILIQWFGLVGILIATVLAYFVEKAYLIYQANRHGFKGQDYIPTKSIVIFLCLMTIFWLMAWMIFKPELI